jgi:GPH family glycoside/pentoside/hexuronide:cation symporter
LADRQAASGERLSGRTLYGYGLGSVAQGVAGQALSTSIISQFLFLVVGMPALLVGAAIVISQIVDAVVDPLLGLWSDRVRGPLGRRHPFMYASAIPCAVAFYALWHPPTALGGAALFAYMLALLVVVRLCTSMYEIPSAALAPELSTDYHQRTRVFAVRQYFGTIAGGLMMVLLNVVFLRHDADHPLGVLNRAGYSQWGAIAAGMILVSILWSSWSTHWLIPTLAAPPRRPGGVAAILAEVVGTLRNPSFLALMVSGLVSNIAGGIGSALNPYMTLYFWGLSPQVAGLMLLAYGPAVYIGAVLARRVSTRFGKKPAMIWLSAASLAVSLAPIALRLAGAMPANGSPLLIPILLAAQFLVVACNVMTSVILASMFADLADDNAVRTGARAEGLLFAMNGLIPKISTGVGAFGGSALIAMVGFPARAQQGTVAQSILHALGLAYLPVTAVLYALSIAIIAFYRIDHATHEANMAQLAVEGLGSRSAPAP